MSDTKPITREELDMIGGVAWLIGACLAIIGGAVLLGWGGALVGAGVSAFVLTVTCVIDAANIR